jgi:hypothetical protein
MKPIAHKASNILPSRAHCTSAMVSMQMIDLALIKISPRGANREGVPNKEFCNRRRALSNKQTNCEPCHHDHATEYTSLVCPVSKCSKLPLPLFHTRAVPSDDAVVTIPGILLPSGDIASCNHYSSGGVINPFENCE